MDFGNYTKSMAISFVIQMGRHLILVILKNRNFGLFYFKRLMRRLMDAMKTSVAVMHVVQSQIFLEVLAKYFLTHKSSRISFGISWLKLTITSS